MEKISSIIPSNSRVTTVDMKSSGTARSGTPGFGRDTLPTKEMDRLHHPETATLAIERHKDLMGQREAAKDPRVEIITKLSDKFFNSKAKEDELPEIRNPEKYEGMAGINIDEMRPSAASGPTRSTPRSRAESASLAAASAAANEAEEDTPMMGHRLDVMA